MRWVGAALALAVAGASGATQEPDPAPVPLLVSVVYRGAPKADDLAAVRALGFTGVTWPGTDAAALAELQRLVAPLDLVPVPRPATTFKVATPGPDLRAQIWRAVAHGARSIAFDGGQAAGSGLTDWKGERRPWARTASEFAYQIGASARLFAIAKPGPPVKIDAPVPKGLEMTLLDGGRAWLLIATNITRAPIRGVAHLPKHVPYALWLSLLDGTMLSMLHQAAGPRWTFTIGAGEARVYVIDKNPRLEFGELAIW